MKFKSRLAAIIVRLECPVAPAEKLLRNSKVTLAKSAGAYVIEQVQIGGDGAVA